MKRSTQLMRAKREENAKRRYKNAFKSENRHTLDEEQ